ncbi:amidohydrolase family protein [Phytoactinopolyspora limicola]|uniref:amidohydrolase family protein n=1 Tax=Phytoactinopolyspora limicola TaxID=2715536 RepID=UPI001A9C67F4|nr:amidohydrolase family protein [Phytoactinopolyspora limicola]
MGMNKHINRRTAIGGAIAAATGIVAAQPASARQGYPKKPPRRGEYVIRGGHVVSVDQEIGDIPRADVHVKNGRIVAVGEKLSVRGAAEIDARGKIVMPGFVDTHWHLWNSAMRPFMLNGDPDRGYFNVTNVLGPHFTPTDTYRATRLALAEGISAGITTVHDWSHNVRSPEFADASLRALVETGIRGRFSYGWAQRGPLDVPMDVEGIARTKQRWFADADTTNGLLHLGVASRNVVPGQSPRGAISIELAHEDWGSAREMGLPITLHASPAGLVTLLEEEQLLGPDVQLVHPTLTTAAENDIVAERGTVWSMSSIGEAGRGPAEQIQYYELLQAGALLGLSVDSSSIDSADMFSAMRILYKMTTNRLGPDTGITHRHLLELATIDSARSLGLGDEVGSLTPGKRADIILVNQLDPNMAPPGDPATQLVSLAQPANVDTVLVDGRILLWRGELVDVDTEKVVRDAQQSAAEISARAGWPA